MQDTTKLPAWLARRGYSARLKRRLARGGRPAEERPEPEPAPAPRSIGGIVLPFPERRLRAPAG